MTLPRKQIGAKSFNTTSHKQIVKSKKGKDKEVVFEEGIPLDPANKVNLVAEKGQVIVGMAKGLTINLGGFESARVDVWITTTVDKKDEAKTLDEMAIRIDDVLGSELQDLAKIATKRK